MAMRVYLNANGLSQVFAVLCCIPRDGGDGTDTLSLRSVVNDLQIVSLLITGPQGGFGNGDTIINFENLLSANTTFGRNNIIGAALTCRAACR